MVWQLARAGAGQPWAGMETCPYARNGRVAGMETCPYARNGRVAGMETCPYARNGRVAGMETCPTLAMGGWHKARRCRGQVWKPALRPQWAGGTRPEDVGGLSIAAGGGGRYGNLPLRSQWAGGRYGNLPLRWQWAGGTRPQKRASHPGTYAHGAPNKIWHETPLIGFCVLGDFEYNTCVSGDEWSRRRRLIRDCEPRRPTA